MRGKNYINTINFASATQGFFFILGYRFSPQQKQTESALDGDPESPGVKSCAQN
jgi:hypothetical protein